MSKSKSKSAFYIPSSTSNGGSSVGSSQELPMTKKSPLFDAEPRLLPGEIIVQKLDNVKKYLQPYRTTNATSSGPGSVSSGSGTIGSLYCTTFKLSFVTPVDSSEVNEIIKHNFIHVDDIPLTNISACYQISGDKIKRASLNKLSGSSTMLRIHTKSFGVYFFDLSEATKNLRKSLVRAVVHHSTPRQHDLLYGVVFDPSELVMDSNTDDSDVMSDIDTWKPPDYTTKKDWEKELRRLLADKSWRVTQINESFNVSETMPEYFPVPAQIEDSLLGEAAPQFTGNRLPIWCYTHTNGCTLVSMSHLSIETMHINLENRLIEAIVKPENLDHRIETLEKDISKDIATVTDIQNSYLKLSSICVSASSKEFNESDITVYGLMDSSRWFRYVSSCIMHATMFAEKLDSGTHHILMKENDSRDLSCLISCLVQVIIDKNCRTIKGLQNLIQRCWVACGHPFCDRISIVGTSQDSEAPVFLLFLDCLYQLTIQYSSAFEFSEIYLIALWDSYLSGLFREFLFNCNHDRKPVRKQYRDASVSNHSSSSSKAKASVWRWDVQYDSDFISLFKNPLYDFVSQELDSNKGRCQMLKPSHHISQLEIWHGCYYRFVSHMQIENGGKPAEYFQQCLLMEEVTELKNQISKLKSSSMSRRSGLFFNNSQHESLLSKLRSSYIISSFPFNNHMSRNLSDISLCTMLEKSLILSDSLGAQDDP